MGCVGVQIAHAVPHQDSLLPLFPRFVPHCRHVHIWNVSQTAVSKAVGQLYACSACAHGVHKVYTDQKKARKKKHTIAPIPRSATSAELQEQEQPRCHRRRPVVPSSVTPASLDRAESKTPLESSPIRDQRRQIRTPNEFPRQSCELSHALQMLPKRGEDGYGSGTDQSDDYPHSTPA